MHNFFLTCDCVDYLDYSTSKRHQETDCGVCFNWNSLSIIEILRFVESTSVVVRFTKQPTVHTSTFGVKLTILKLATEEVFQMRYYLWLMSIKVNKITLLYVHNEEIILNMINPAFILNKKILALACHFICKHQHGRIIDV